MELYEGRRREGGDGGCQQRNTGATIEMEQREREREGEGGGGFSARGPDAHNSTQLDTMTRKTRVRRMNEAEER